ncbi:MAG: hypothetical protein MI924_14880 [Chloroflexales bacterium]|nr:hypothetical protein [Chloroflexales bacterium]
MYDGNGSGNGNGGYNSGSGYNGSRYVNIGGFRIKPMYMYVAIGVVILLAIYFVMRFLNTGLVMHFGLVAGVLLLLANLRELIGMSYAQRGSTALLNSLIGGALFFAWLSQLAGALFWIPAVLLMVVAVPLVLGRVSVYSTYVQTARSAVSNMRRAVGR